MRWPWTRGDDAIEAPDPEPLAIIELETAGPLSGAQRRPDEELREVPDRPTGHDPTGLAGIWEALARS